MKELAMAVRPKTLAASVVPVAVGTAIAFRTNEANGWVAGAALLGALSIQIGTNLVNDVADHARGADGSDRLGPSRAVASGLMTPREAWAFAAASFGLAILVGTYLVATGGAWVLAIGVASILAGLLYTAGPWPLAYHGLGDLFVMLFFGFVAVLGTVYVQTGGASMIAVVAAIPVGALGAAILAVNNLRDRFSDARAQKRTLVVRFGRRFGLAEYVGLMVLAYAAPLSIGGAALLPLVTLPLAVHSTQIVAREDGRALNRALGMTSLLLLLFGLLFAVGLAVGGA